jgi:DNA-binding transcriptional MerR regulator/methylmalonyl-CoA mutase cobalamin-binding subunit
MKSVAQRTGLSPHVIRVWEKRYGAVEPRRSATNRRRYSETEVRRLALLHAATKAGHSIGMIARLPDEQLQVLSENAAAAVAAMPRVVPPGGSGVHAYLEDALAAVRRMDAHELEAVLLRASLEVGCQGLLQKLIAPLTQRLGELWQAGEVTIAEEHFATGTVRVFLANLARPFLRPDTAPGLVVATPAGQVHELGAVLVSTAAGAHGWRVTYLGSGLPAVEIAGAALRTGARAVALSIVYPADDPGLPQQLLALRSYLPDGVAIVAGGRAVGAYRSTLASIGARIATNLADLQAILDAIRSPGEDRGAN